MAVETMRPGRANGTGPIAGIDPFLVTNLVSDKLVVEIDWVAGAVPDEDAVQALEAVLRESCERGRRIEVNRDDEIPFAAWSEATASARGAARLAGAWLDHDPAAWETTELIYVLYVPSGDPWFDDGLSGFATWLSVERDEPTVPVRTVFLFTERIREAAMLWVNGRKIERAMLVHELGHLVGLVGDPDHEQETYPGHCTTTHCVMHRSGVGGMFVNAFPAVFAGKVHYRYCKRCRKEIDRGRVEWLRRATEDPGVAEDLRARREAAEKDAARRAFWKERLPADEP